MIFGRTPNEDKWVQSCTIITTKPNDLLKPVHDRMPVILDKDGVQAWLDPEVTEKDHLQSLLMPFDSEKMKCYPVSKLVGNVKNKMPDLIHDISEKAPEDKQVKTKAETNIDEDKELNSK